MLERRKKRAGHLSYFQQMKVSKNGLVSPKYARRWKAFVWKKGLQKLSGCGLHYYFNLEEILY